MISSHYAKLPYFSPNTKLPNHGFPQETKGEILKTCKTEFDWLKMIFFIKEDIQYSIIFAKFQAISSQYAKLPYFSPNTKLPNHGFPQTTKGEILKTCKNEFDWLKMIFFIKEDTFHHLCKVSSDFKPICQVTLFHPQIPNYLNQALAEETIVEILKTCKNEFNWLEMIFFMQEDVPNEWLI